MMNKDFQICGIEGAQLSSV